MLVTAAPVAPAALVVPVETLMELVHCVMIPIGPVLTAETAPAAGRVVVAVRTEVVVTEER